MIVSPFKRFFTALNDLLLHPWRVFFICLAFLFLSLVIEGSLLRLWRLHRDASNITQRMEGVRQEIAGLEMKIERASDPAFIELEARERFDLASEGDLIFVFSEP